MFSVNVMQILHTKVDKVQVAASNFKISSTDTESTPSTMGFGDRIKLFLEYVE